MQPLPIQRNLDGQEALHWPCQKKLHDVIVSPIEAFFSVSAHVFPTI